jgi:hypothetical protein
VIIGIAGPIGSGKTTCANVAVGMQEYNFRRVGFGDALKEEVYKFLVGSGSNINKPLLWGTQEDKEKTIVSVNPNFITEEMHQLHILSFSENNCTGCDMEISLRKLLQWWGTNYRRRQDPKYWLKAYLRQIGPWDNIVTDDVRFINEATFIQELGGKLIKIEREPSYPSDHASERDLDTYKDWDEIISNEADLEYFKGDCVSTISSLMDEHL